MAVTFDTLKATTRLREKERLGGAIGTGVAILVAVDKLRDV